MNYNTISAQRIAGALGAEIASVDLSRPLSDEVIGEIRQALLDHQVIFFHDQHLTPEQHLAFGRRFGELQIHDFVEPAEEDQHILEVRKEPYETRNFGGGWHTDVSYLERPSLGSVLYAHEVPAVGGDTQPIMRIVVDLPAPFGPRNPNASPGSTVKAMSSTATKSPYCFTNPEAATSDLVTLSEATESTPCATVGYPKNTSATP